MTDYNNLSREELLALLQKSKPSPDVTPVATPSNCKFVARKTGKACVQKASTPWDFCTLHSRTMQGRRAQEAYEASIEPVPQPVNEPVPVDVEPPKKVVQEVTVSPPSNVDETLSPLPRHLSSEIPPSRPSSFTDVEEVVSQKTQKTKKAVKTSRKKKKSVSIAIRKNDLGMFVYKTKWGVDLCIKPVDGKPVAYGKFDGTPTPAVLSNDDVDRIENGEAANISLADDAFIEVDSDEVEYSTDDGLDESEDESEDETEYESEDESEDETEGESDEEEYESD